MADASPSPTQAGSPSPDGEGVFNPSAGFLNSEARRTLGAPTYSQTAPSTVDIPRDTVLKRMLLKMVSTFSVTYASGSPVYSKYGIFDRICPTVEINVNGNRIIKSVKPWMVRMHNILLQGGGLPPRTVSPDSAAAFTTTRPKYTWMAGTIAYPATTRFSLFNESIELNFENPFGYGGSRHMTELDLRDVASAVIKFYWAPLTAVQDDSVAATVTYGASSITVTPQIIENRARPRPQPGQTLFDYVESNFSRTYTGQARSQQIDLQTGNYVMGLGIFCQNGDSSYTNQENLLTNIALKINGSSAIQGPVSHADLQDENIARYGAMDISGIADVASTIASTADVHALRGFALMSLIRNGNWNTALNSSRQAGVDSCKLEFDTPSSSGTDAATYTNNLTVTLHQHEIRPFVYTR